MDAVGGGSFLHPPPAARHDTVRRVARRVAPEALSAAAVRNAAGMLTVAATSPRTTGPPVKPRSMNTLAVPAALPLWDGDTWRKIAANTAGARKAVPTASSVAPRNSP